MISTYYDRYGQLRSSPQPFTPAAGVASFTTTSSTWTGIMTWAIHLLHATQTVLMCFAFCVYSAILSCFILPYCIAVVLYVGLDFCTSWNHRIFLKPMFIGWWYNWYKSSKTPWQKHLTSTDKCNTKCNDLCHIMPHSQTSHLFAPALVSKSMPTTRSVKSPVNCIRTGWTMSHVEPLNDLFCLSSTAFCKWIQMFLVASHVVHDVSFVGWLSFQIGRLKKLAAFSEDLADDSFFSVDGKDKSWPFTQGGIWSWLMTVTFVDTLLKWNLNDVYNLSLVIEPKEHQRDWFILQ